MTAGGCNCHSCTARIELLEEIRAVELRALERERERANGLLKSRDAAAYLACSTSQLDNLVRRGDIVPVMLDSDRRYTRADLDGYIERLRLRESV